MNFAAVASHLADRGNERANEGAGDLTSSVCSSSFPHRMRLVFYVINYGVCLCLNIEPPFTILLDIGNAIVVVDWRA